MSLQKEKTLLTEPQDIVNELADTYQKFSSNQSYSNEFLTYKQEEEAVPITISDEFNAINIPLSYGEFEDALNSIKDTAPGPDDIPIQFIKKLPMEAKEFLLQIFNIIWEQKSFPKIWKNAIVIPIIKANKDKLHPESYRPISLTCSSC